MRGEAHGMRVDVAEDGALDQGHKDLTLSLTKGEVRIPGVSEPIPDSSS